MLLVDQLNKDTIVVPINAQDSSGAVQELWQTACSEIGPEADFTTIVQCVENRAGVEVKPKK